VAKILFAATLSWLCKYSATAQAILTTARQNNAKAIVLGHCQEMTPAIFQKVIGEVTTQAPCPTMVLKFTGILHTEKILVAVVSLRELYAIRDAVRALAIVGKHQISLLQGPFLL